MSRRKMQSRQQILRVAQEAVQQEAADMMCRWMKIALVALNREFGFGKERIARFLTQVGRTASLAPGDEAFWIHVDQRLEQMGVAAPREEE